MCDFSYGDPAFAKLVFMKEDDKMGNDSNNDKKEDIIIYSVIGITFVIAIVLAFRFGFRSKTVFYLLILFEAAVYFGIKWLFDKFK